PGTFSGNVNQVQRLVITAPGGLATAGGTFTLSYGASSNQSAVVAFSPTPTTLRQNVQTALNIFGTGPNAIATLISSPTDLNQVVIDITFTNLLGGTRLQALKLDGGNTTGGNLSGATGTTAVITTGSGNEVQDITLPTAADATTGGTFTMVYLSDSVAS